jgi:antirestriction protein
MHHEQPHQPAALEGDPAPLLDLAQQPAAPAEHHVGEPTVIPRIWVASLADYNHGTLHGAWLDAAQDEADLRAGIDAMLATSPLTAQTGEPAEEWAIHDYEHFGALRIYEHENLSWVTRVAKGIAQHGLAFAAYADVMEEERLLDGFEGAYLGHYDDLHAYVEQLINDLGYDELLDRVVPTMLRPYVKIDVAATARDLEFGGELHVLSAAQVGVWIFRG